MPFPVGYFDLSSLHDTTAMPLLQIPSGVGGCVSCAILSGPSGSGKTSLAFQYAVTAACLGESVLYCASQKGIQARVPQPQIPLHQLPDDVLGRIEFVYVESLDGVCQALSTVGTSASCCDAIPRHIIVEEGELVGGGAGGAAVDVRPTAAAMACLVSTVRDLRAATGVSTCGLYVLDRALGDPAALGTFPYAVADTWAAVTIGTESTAEGGQQQVMRAVVVQHGLPVGGAADGAAADGYTMAFAFKEEAMHVTAPLAPSANSWA